MAITTPPLHPRIRTRELSTEYAAQENVSFDNARNFPILHHMTYNRCHPGMYCPGQILSGLSSIMCQRGYRAKLFSITLSPLLSS